MLKEKIKQLKRVLGVPESEPIQPPVKDPDIKITPINEIIPSQAEIDEMNVEVDAGYLQYSAEVVGYENRENQWNAYRTVMSYTDTDSILDFGCGRGDLATFLQSEFPDAVYQYTGVDVNEHLINAGKEIYPEVNLIRSDWFDLDSNLKADWVVNIGSCNLRYDADVVNDDFEFTKKSLQCMYEHCDKGIVTMFTSKFAKVDDGLINHDPGDILNWAQENFGNVAIDHSIGDDVFILIIYKV